MNLTRTRKQTCHCKSFSRPMSLWRHSTYEKRSSVDRPEQPASTPEQKAKTLDIKISQVSHIQAAVDTLASRATADKFQLNETKCKELLINFNTKNPTSFDPVVVNGMPIDLVTSAKILGLNISNDLKWNCHIDSISKSCLQRSKLCFYFSCLLRWHSHP